MKEWWRKVFPRVTREQLEWREEFAALVRRANAVLPAGEAQLDPATDTWADVLRKLTEGLEAMPRCCDKDDL